MEEKDQEMLRLCLMMARVTNKMSWWVFKALAEDVAQQNHDSWLI